MTFRPIPVETNASLSESCLSLRRREYDGILNIVLGLFIYGLFYAIFRLTKEVGILKDKVEELESAKEESKD